MSKDAPLAKSEKSTITGAFQPIAPDGRVHYRPLEGRWQRIGTIAIACLAVLLSIVYVTVLVMSAVIAFQEGGQQFVTIVAVLALGNEIVKTPLVFTLAYAAAFAKKPIPVRQDKTLNVLLGITFVPKSEDINRLRDVLVAAQHITHTDGAFAIAVFDEGSINDPFAVIDLINNLNARGSGHHIYRISRLGSHRYNKKKGRFSEKTKYGNINAALAQVYFHPEIYGKYDILLGLDPDHLPMETFAERMLGPFNDPDVAFVVGPQAYANATYNNVARGGESNQYVFHALVQSVANTHEAAMLVGTSYAIRLSVLKQINGIQPSITEDLATTFAVLSRRNPATKRPWKSVYNPDVLAHGEGPSSWGDFFKQQDRWARGALEFMWRGPFVKQMLGMWRRPLRIMHYTMLMAFYPIMAVSWLLAAANSALIALVGASGRILDPDVWLIFYGWATLAQIWLYFRMRRHNVSPFERRNSWGFYGMFMGVVTAPVFANALVKTIFRRPVGFSVTPKGVKTNEDRLFTFRLHIGWILFYVNLIVVGYFNHHLNAATLAWALLAISLLASPMVIWKLSWRFDTSEEAPVQDGAEPLAVTAPNPIIHPPLREEPQ